MTPEQIRTLSDSLKVMTFSHEGAKESLRLFCDNFYDEAVEQLTMPKLSDEERAYWSGALANSMEIRNHFNDLITGEYQKWPMMRAEGKDD